MKDLVIYGAGGFGREVACMIRGINVVKPKWNLLGFIDDGFKNVVKNRYGEVLGNLDFLNAYSKPLDVVIAIATPQIRVNIVNRVTNPLISWPNLIAQDVRICDQESLMMGKGNILFYSCSVSCDVAIGNFNLLNSQVCIGHDAIIGNYNVIMPNTRILGGSKIGDQNFFGINALMLQGLKVGNNTRVGATSVLMHNAKDNFLYFGNPARRIIE